MFNEFLKLWQNTAESLAQRKEIQCTVKLPLATTLYKATIYPKTPNFSQSNPYNQSQPLVNDWWTTPCERPQLLFGLTVTLFSFLTTYKLPCPIK